MTFVSCSYTVVICSPNAFQLCGVCLLVGYSYVNKCLSLKRLVSIPYTRHTEKVVKRSPIQSTVCLSSAPQIPSMFASGWGNKLKPSVSLEAGNFVLCYSY